MREREGEREGERERGRERQLDGNVQQFRGGLGFKAHRLYVSLNFRLESNEEEEKNKMKIKPPIRIPELVKRVVEVDSG